MEIPKNGINYITASILFGMSLKETIKTVNKMVSNGELRFDRMENGMAWWVRDTPTPFDQQATKASVLVTCRCGKQFVARSRCNKHCSDVCRDAARGGSNPTYLRRKVTEKRLCLVCKEPFVAVANCQADLRKTCSLVCAHKLRHV